MKRCPECRRDYYDDTLSFCLNDGIELVYGLSPEEPATAIQSQRERAATDFPSSESPTHTQVDTSNDNANLTGNNRDASPLTPGLDRRLLAVPIVLAIVVLGGFLGYRYFAPTPSRQIDSIAVMPFVNGGGNADNEYLSDGLSESLINSLSRLPGLAVKAPSTVFRYKGKDVTSQQVGSELSVQAVLNGRMMLRGDQLTLSLDLVNASTGDQIWGKQYSRKVAELVSLQADAANEISQKLRAKLSREDRQRLSKGSTTNPEAYQLYLKGNYFSSLYSKEGTQKGLEYFNQAITADPEYALAYNGLAYYYLVAAEAYVDSRVAMPKARDAAIKALQIDETLAAAHTSLGVVADWYDWDWAVAEREFKRANELDPNDYRTHQYYSLYLVKQGRREEGIAEARRTQQIDPISPEAGMFLGLMLHLVRQYDEAIDVMQKTIEIDDSFFYSHTVLGRAYEQKGRLPEAITEFQRAVQIEPAFSENWSWLGHAYALSSNKTEALKIIDTLKERSRTDYVAPTYIATVYAGLGEGDQVFTWLGHAYDERQAIITGLTVDQQWDPFRSDPRFKELVKKVGLPNVNYETMP